MPRPKSKKNMYFDLDVQDAIVRYNSLDPIKDQAKRSRIYGQEIHRAFDKLAENIINTFKFSYFDYGFEDIKCEVVAFLVINMHKYDHTKGSKAFSYFSVVAKNYLIFHNNSNYKKMKMTDNIDVLKYKMIDDHTSENLSDLIDQIIIYFERNMTKIFNKKRDLDIAYAIIELLRRKDEIENYNKKNLYILIREMTDVNTSYITTVVNVFKKKYKTILNEFYIEGYVKPDKISTFKKFFD